MAAPLRTLSIGPPVPVNDRCSGATRPQSDWDATALPAHEVTPHLADLQRGGDHLQLCGCRRVLPDDAGTLHLSSQRASVQSAGREACKWRTLAIAAAKATCRHWGSLRKVRRSRLELTGKSHANTRSRTPHVPWYPTSRSTTQRLVVICAIWVHA